MSLHDISQLSWVFILGIYVTSEESIFFLLMKTKGPWKEAFFPSSLAFFTGAKASPLLLYLRGRVLPWSSVCCQEESLSPWSPSRQHRGGVASQTGWWSLPDAVEDVDPLLQTVAKFGSHLPQDIDDLAPDVLSLLLFHAMNLQGPPSAITLTVSDVCLRILFSACSLWITLSMLSNVCFCWLTSNVSFCRG